MAEQQDKPKIRGILIDPFTQQVREVFFRGDIKEIYALIGADCFDTVRVTRRDIIFVDDVGLVGDQSKQKYFKWADYPQPLAGKGLLAGITQEGDTTSPFLTLSEVQAKVSFPNVQCVGFDESTTSTGGITVFERRAKFEPR